MKKLQHDQILPDDKFDFTPEERQLITDVWNHTKQTLDSVDLLSRYLRWANQKAPKFLARPDLALHNSHDGYIYAICDPRIAGEKNIIFIGSSRQPWTAVARHLKRSSNTDMRDYVKKMMSELRAKGYVYWRKKEVVEAYEEQREVSPLKFDSGIEIPWKILGVYMDAELYELELEKVQKTYGSIENVEPNWSRNEWTERLMDQGHPVLNGRPGRKGDEYPWERQESVMEDDLLNPVEDFDESIWNGLPNK